MFAEGNGGYNFCLLSTTSMPAATAFSLGVDQILACWTGNMFQTDEQTSGESTSYNSTLPDLHLARSATVLSPTGPIRIDQGLVIPAVQMCVCVCEFIRWPLAWAICRIPLSSPSIYICVHEPLLPDEFRASSQPVVAYVPGVMFSSPVVCGFETSVMPL